MIHPSGDQQEWRTVINVKIEEICSACLRAVGRRQQCSVSCCLFSEPSGMPAGVWARSVSASEIEVNWQALSFTPERVLGYEVHFTLLNGNRNHTHNTIQMLVIAPVVPQNHHFQTLRRHGNGCLSWATVTAKITHFFVSARQENMSERFQEKPFHAAVSCCVGYHDAGLHDSLRCNATPRLVSE